MPSAQTSSARSARSSLKSAGPRSASGRSRGATRTKAPRTQASASSNGSRASARAGADRPVGALGDYAERAILIPVGAALIARERMVASVNDTIATYSSSSKAQAQLRRFERRGATARNRLEREVRKTRVRVERELRQRRRGIEKTVEERRDAASKSRADLSSRVPELANRVQERILGLV